jgi:hypothetical protein
MSAFAFAAMATIESKWHGKDRTVLGPDWPMELLWYR